MTPPDLLLAIEGSSNLASVALARDGVVVERAFLPERERQAALLVPRIREILTGAGVAPAELAGIVIGRGPGSFTGVRVAIATARGLAFAAQLPIWPVSSLAGAAASDRAKLPAEFLGAASRVRAIERSGEGDDRPRFVLFDARADRLYGGCWRFLPDRVEEIVAPTALTLDRFLDLDLPPDVLLCGDGAHRHLEILEAHDHRILPYPAGLPLAEGLLRMHTLAPAPAPELPGSAWEPEYLRPAQPEREGSWAAT